MSSWTANCKCELEFDDAGGDEAEAGIEAGDEGGGKGGGDGDGEGGDRSDDLKNFRWPRKDWPTSKMCSTVFVYR